MAEPFYTCCEDGMLSQVPPPDRSGLCPACKPKRPAQPLLSDDDWQAIADEAGRIIPGKVIAVIQKHIAVALASAPSAAAFPAIQPTDEGCVAHGLAHPCEDCATELHALQEAQEEQITASAAPQPAKAADALTDEQRAQIIEALEAASNGLQFYRDRCPDAVDGSDDEADEMIAAAIGTLHLLAPSSAASASPATQPITSGVKEVPRG